MVKLFLVVLIICLAFSLFACLLKIFHIYGKINEVTEILSEVEINGTNRKALIKDTELLAPLVYQVNHIVYTYEERLHELQTADETNKQLMTSLSHDVRTPLTTLIGYLDAAHNGLVEGQEREEYIETARQRAYDLKEYIDVLFDWFRLNSNEFSLSVEATEIAELTRCILKDWIPVFREKALDYDIEIPMKRLMVNIDVDGYSRVINNLVQNVLAHSHANEIQIIMRNIEKYVEIRVQDDGVGISKDDLQHIFERLYKCDKGRSEKGSGLGLAITRQIIERMGGTISVESKLNEYTVFIIKFFLI